MIDLYTAQLATSVVTTVSGVMFILDLLFGRSDAAGRLWAVSYMSGMLTAVAYAIAILLPGAWWAVGVGNGAMVFTAGLLWSGARTFNGRSALVWVAAAGAVVGAVVVFLTGPDGGAWAGSWMLFPAIALFSVLGGVESLRPPMRASWAARGLTVAFGIVAVYYVLRTGVLLIAGVGSREFRTLFGGEAAAFVMMTLVIVTTICLVVLRTERRAAERSGLVAGPRGGVVPSVESQRPSVEDWLERASFHDEQLVFARVRLDEMDAIDLAFGRSAGAALAERFAEAVRRYSPPTAAIGLIDTGELLVVAPFARIDDARRAVAAVQAGLGEQLVSETEGIRLSSSIGLAGTDAIGYDYSRLLEGSAEALERAAANGGDTVAE